jgi:hypothetical protein
MALYKDGDRLKHSNDAIFDQVNSPGTAAPRAGIYRCLGCGREIAIAESHILPPQNHHEHSTTQGHIRWQLLVYANHRPS